MNSKKVVPLVALVFFGLTTFGFSSVAIADPCWLHLDADADYAIANSDLVFIGTAITKRTEIFESLEFDIDHHISAERTTFVVESVEKGKVDAGDKIDVEKGKRCSCAGKFEIGKKYLVHTRLLEAEKLPTLHLCDLNKEIE